jgi:hypothetical protein
MTPITVNGCPSIRIERPTTRRIMRPGMPTVRASAPPRHAPRPALVGAEHASQHRRDAQQRDSSGETAMRITSRGRSAPPSPAPVSVTPRGGPQGRRVLHDGKLGERTHCRCRRWSCARARATDSPATPSTATPAARTGAARAARWRPRYTPRERRQPDAQRRDGSTARHRRAQRGVSPLRSASRPQRPLRRQRIDGRARSPAPLRMASESAANHASTSPGTPRVAHRIVEAVAVRLAHREPHLSRKSCG